MSWFHLSLRLSLVAVFCFNKFAEALLIKADHPSHLNPLPLEYVQLLRDTPFCLPEGVLIDSSWVLTASKDKFWEVTVPRFNESWQVTSSRKSPVDYIIHAENLYKKERPLQLLHLKEPITGIRPVPRVRYLYQDYTLFFLAGFNKDPRTSQINKIIGENVGNVTPFHDIQMSFELNRLGLGLQKIDYTRLETWIAVLDVDNSSDRASGAFIQKSDGSFQLLGILYKGVNKEVQVKGGAVIQVQGEMNHFVDNIIVADALGGRVAATRALALHYDSQQYVPKGKLKSEESSPFFELERKERESKRPAYRMLERPLLIDCSWALVRKDVPSGQNDRIFIDGRRHDVDESLESDQFNLRLIHLQRPATKAPLTPRIRCTPEEVYTGSGLRLTPNENTWIDNIIIVYAIGRRDEALAASAG